MHQERILIQSVQFDDKDRMIAFCQAIQYASPINSHFYAICKLYAGL